MKPLTEKPCSFVVDNALVACFDKSGNVTEALVKQLADYESMHLVFRDAGFASDSTKINVEQVLKQLSPNTDVKSILGGGMMLKFKHQSYQADSVQAVVDCFKGQLPNDAASRYRIDPGSVAKGRSGELEQVEAGFKNAGIQLTEQQLLTNVQQVQHHQNLPQSSKLKSTPVCKLNFDIEMETSTGKTYCFVKSIFELNKQYGWSKFIIVVPSIAIREGGHKSLEITAEHFLEGYGKRARFFIYHSKVASA